MYICIPYIHINASLLGNTCCRISHNFTILTCPLTETRRECLLTLNHGCNASTQDNWEVRTVQTSRMTASFGNLFFVGFQFCFTSTFGFVVIFAGGCCVLFFSWLELHLLWRIFPNRIAGFVSMSLPLIFFVKCFVHKSPDLHGNHGFLNGVPLTLNDLVVSTHLKNISQNGSFPQSKGLKKGLKPPPRWWSSNTLMKKHAILLYCSSLIVLSSHVSF